jgi:hypothetical protein
MSASKRYITNWKNDEVPTIETIVLVEGPWDSSIIQPTPSAKR